MDLASHWARAGVACCRCHLGQPAVLLLVKHLPGYRVHGAEVRNQLTLSKGDYSGWRGAGGVVLIKSDGRPEGRAEASLQKKLFRCARESQSAPLRRARFSREMGKQNQWDVYMVPCFLFKKIFGKTTH